RCTKGQEMPRACFIFLIFFISFAFSPNAVISQTQQQDSGVKVDLLIRGGQVLDGTGAEAVQADVGVRADRIVFLGDSRTQHMDAARVIDAAGVIVSLSFIDKNTTADVDMHDAVSMSY